MTARKSRADFKKMTIDVTVDHWKRAKLMCRHEIVTKTLPNGTKVKSNGVSANCIIADALVEWLGADAPLTEQWFFDTKTKQTVRKLFIDVSVGASDARVGKANFRHNGANLVEAFDSELKLAQAKENYNIDLPMKVTFTRTK